MSGAGDFASLRRLTTKNTSHVWRSDPFGRPTVGAITEFQQLVTDSIRVLGPEAPDTLLARNNFAYLLGVGGHVDEAITAFQQLVADRIRVLGPDSPEALLARHNLAHWIGTSGCLTEAITAFQQLRIDQPSPPGVHLPLLLIALRNGPATSKAEVGSAMMIGHQRADAFDRRV
jgi:hypothetical protein